MKVNHYIYRQLMLATVMEKLFFSIKFEAFRWKGLYRFKATNEAGRSVIITINQLFSQTKTRRKIYDLTSTLWIPKMNRAEYREFIQELMDTATDLDEFPSIAEQRRLRIFWRTEKRNEFKAMVAQDSCPPGGDEQYLGL